ncbi:S-layer homology domain-containing protein [Paenibacillus sp. TRM 82003]|nr:S-layer homology domain-containing protein [Paenibacillus sp. TRM 82003]
MRTPIRVVQWVLCIAMLIVPLAAAEAEQSKVISIEAGQHHAVALKDDGTVWTWGENDKLQLGLEGLPRSKTARKVEGLPPIERIAAGGSFSLAVDRDGTVWGWGANVSGVLRTESTTPVAKPVILYTDRNIVSIAAGEAHGVVLLKAGKVYAWGDNTYGQLGVDNLKVLNSKANVNVERLSDIVEISAGPYHNLALSNSGKVWEWGYSTRSYFPTPGLVATGKTYASIYATVAKDVAEKDAGNAYAQEAEGTWVKLGNNEILSLGQNIDAILEDAEGGFVYLRNGKVSATYNHSEFADLGLSGVTQAVAGVNFFAALDRDGGVWNWSMGAEPVRVTGFQSDVLFSDMGGHWAKEFVVGLVQKNVISGYVDGTYRPEEQVTREQFLKMIMTSKPYLFETYSQRSERQTFKDVPKDRWSHAFVEAAVNAGIVHPGDYKDEAFGPETPISRIEMAILVGRAAGSSIDGPLNSDFIDKEEILDDIDHLVRSATKDRTLEQQRQKTYSELNYIFKAGLISGYEDNSFRPKEKLTRGQAAKVIYYISK